MQFGWKVLCGTFLFVFVPVSQEDMLFKDISYLELWWPVCLAKQKQWCNFGRGHHGEHFCEIILNLDQWFRQMTFKDISYLEIW